jgi:hypothetical protein
MELPCSANRWRVYLNDRSGYFSEMALCSARGRKALNNGRHPRPAMMRKTGQNPTYKVG